MADKYTNFRYNVKNTYMCLLEADTREGVTYTGEPEHMPGLMSVQDTTVYASAPLFGDGAQRHEMTKILRHDLVINHNKIAYSQLVKYLGSKINVAKGIVRENVSDKFPFFALMFEVETTEGREILCYPKCKLSPGEKSYQQSTDNIEYSTDTFNVVALPLEYSGDTKYYGDTGDNDLKTLEQVANDWFKNVYIETPEEPEEP